MARPTKMTTLTVKKLEEAFVLGCSDEEACLYADISKQTLYNYQEKNLSFLDRKTLLKTTPVLKARQAVIAALEQNPALALRFLERRKRDEFHPRLDIDTDSGPLQVVIQNYTETA